MSAMRDRSWSMWSFTIWFFFSTSCSIIVSQKGLPALNLTDLFHFSLTSERGLFFSPIPYDMLQKLLLSNPTSKTLCITAYNVHKLQVGNKFMLIRRNILL
jgi:hypothetical protein